jgi:small conductance mechanosensitive channel
LYSTPGRGCAEYSWRVFAALAILVLGLLFAAAIQRLLYIVLHARALPVRKVHSIAHIRSLAVVLLTFTLMLAVLGLAGPVIGFIVTVGLALGVLADSFSGLRILTTQPFRIGDLIEIKGEGVIGSLMEITISDITLETADNTRVIVPNRKLLDSLVINHSPSSAQKVLRF